MTTNTDTAARAATRSGVLRHGETTLLGLAGPEADLAALIRLPGGRVRRVKRGDRLPSGRVIAIDVKGVIVEQGGRTRRMVIPGG